MKHVPTTHGNVSRPLPPFDRPATPPDRPRRSYFKAFGVAKAFGLAFAYVAAAGCGTSGGGSFTPHENGTHNIGRALPAVSPTPAPAEAQSCDGDGTNAGCHVTKNPNVAASGSYSTGLTVTQLRGAYGLPAVSGGATPTGPIVAIVDAFENRNAESDLGVYRAQFGLPPCTSANGCFTKVMMSGAKVPPGQAKMMNNGTGLTTWADEIALDLAMASAACPELPVVAGGDRRPGSRQPRRGREPRGHVRPGRDQQQLGVSSRAAETLPTSIRRRKPPSIIRGSRSPPVPAISRAKCSSRRHRRT